MNPHERSGRVRQLLWIERNVSSLSYLSAFYQNALGFSVQDAPELHDDATWSKLLGKRISRSAFLELGKQRLHLVEMESPGQPYPANSNSADLWFQHFAIVAKEMNQAYAALQSHAFTPISVNGPQQLPLSTGNVTAFKFRDPDGHPVELICFPSGGDPRWQTTLLTTVPTMGIDHSALSVSNAETSIAFYCDRLGLSLMSRQTNSGSAQERLDALQDDIVDVITLTCAEVRTPHIELLAYNRPKGRDLSEYVQSGDIAGDKLILQIDDLAAILARLNPASILKQVAAGDDGAALIRDPDGHLLILTNMQTPSQGA